MNIMLGMRYFKRTTPCVTSSAEFIEITVLKSEDKIHFISFMRFAISYPVLLHKNIINISHN